MMKIASVTIEWEPLTDADREQVTTAIDGETGTFEIGKIATFTDPKWETQGPFYPDDFGLLKKIGEIIQISNRRAKDASHYAAKAEQTRLALATEQELDASPEVD